MQFTDDLHMITNIMSIMYCVCNYRNISLWSKVLKCKWISVEQCCTFTEIRTGTLVCVCVFDDSLTDGGSI